MSEKGSWGASQIVLCMQIVKLSMCPCRLVIQTAGLAMA